MGGVLPVETNEWQDPDGEWTEMLAGTPQAEAEISEGIRAVPDTKHFAVVHVRC